MSPRIGLSHIALQHRIQIRPSFELVDIVEPDLFIRNLLLKFRKVDAFTTETRRSACFVSA